MSMFYCELHARMEDSDFVGIRNVDGKEYCDEGGVEVLIAQEEAQNSSTNEEVCPSF